MEGARAELRKQHGSIVWPHALKTIDPQRGVQSSRGRRKTEPDTVARKLAERALNNAGQSARDVRFLRAMTMSIIENNAPTTSSMEGSGVATY